MYNFWFYQGCPKWLDVDADGLPDLIAARTVVKNATGTHHTASTTSQLVWFKNNGGNKWGATEVLFRGPGAAITLVDIDDNGSTEIVSYESYMNK